MDEYSVEIDQLHEGAVVLVVPAMRLLVFGRTIDEARRSGEGFDQVSRARDWPPH